MKRRNFIACIAVATMALLTGCKTELDMRDFDGHVQMDMGLALPIGSMKMTLEDILGMTPAAGYIGYEDDGTLFYDGTFDVTKEFHPVDISDKSTEKELKHLHMTDYYLAGDQTFTAGNPQVLTFPVGMKLKHVNDSLDNERFDKVLIKNAQFESTINYRPNYGGTSTIPSTWIQKIEMLLGDQFEREQGKTITLYDRQNGGQLQYNETWPVTIDEFSMSLQLDPNLKGDSSVMNHNVTDSIHFQIRVTIEAPATNNITIDDNSAWEYNMHLGMLEYRAVWGMFSPSDKVRDEGVLVLGDEWSGWSELGQFRLPLHNPVVNLRCVTQVAGQFMVKGKYLYAEDENTGDIRYAQFDANGRHDLEKIWSKDECLSVDSELGDSVALYLQFSKATDEGQIDKMFDIHPDKIGYEFRVDFADKDINPFARITDNTNIDMHINVHVPFAFNEGLLLEYGDTVGNLNLGVLNKDSLKKHVEWIDSLREGKVYLALMIENTLPMAVDGELVFLDELGKQVTYLDSTGREVKLQFWGADTLHISAPTFSPSGDVIEVGKSATDKFYLKTEQLDALSHVKQIYFRAHADDEAFQALKTKNPEKDIYPLRIKKDAALRLRIGVAAKAGAIFDFSNLGKEK